MVRSEWASATSRSARKYLEIHNRREPLQRIAGPRQRRVPLIQIKKTRLPRHQSSPRKMELIESAAIGQRRGFERQGVGRDDAGWLWRLKLPGQDGEDHVAIVYSSFQSLGARGFDGIQSMVETRRSAL